MMLLSEVMEDVSVWKQIVSQYLSARLVLSACSARDARSRGRAEFAERANIGKLFAIICCKEWLINIR